MGKDVIEAVQDKVNKYKKRMKQMGCCGALWMFLGLAAFFSGVALLVNFTMFWGDKTNWRSGLAYTGLALLLIGLLMVAVGISLCSILCVIWKRLQDKDKPACQDMFKPPTFAHGEAPYPQQPPNAAPSDPNHPAPAQPSAPGAPPAASAPLIAGGTGPSDVSIEVSENDKF